MCWMNEATEPFNQAEPIVCFSKVYLLKYLFAKWCKKIVFPNLIEVTLSISCFLYIKLVNIPFCFVIPLNTFLHTKRVGCVKDSCNLGFVLNDKIHPGFFCGSFHNFSKFLRRLFFVIYYNSIIFNIILSSSVFFFLSFFRHPSLGLSMLLLVPRSLLRTDAPQITYHIVIQHPCAIR